MPLFLMLFIGYMLKRAAFISDAFLHIGNKMVFYILLPVALFNNMYMADIQALFDLPFILFLVGSTIGAFFLIWLMTALFVKDTLARGAIVQGAFRSNFVFLGFPLLINLLGEAAAAPAALVIAFIIPLYNIFSTFILVLYGPSEKMLGPAQIAFTVIKNPFIIGIMLGALVSLSGIRLPIMITGTTRYIQNMATPMALLCLGGGMRFEGFNAKFKYAMAASIVKVIIFPAATVGLGLLLGFGGNELAIFLVLAGAPSAIAGYTMAKLMGGDEYVAGSIVVISTLLSAFTLTFGIYLFRVFEVLL